METEGMYFKENERVSKTETKNQQMKKNIKQIYNNNVQNF